ncbi:hypothetical protein OUZ56_029539 [Daphnia magna]|uniref:Uncharacterized protein n=1 Tax=Daphnia magna TaxID=35525 RepID=A0ABR0B745_9CRUS|nr:hypothetical protein OUZ56_029539 [Daphnia magna]
MRLDVANVTASAIISLSIFIFIVSFHLYRWLSFIGTIQNFTNVYLIIKSSCEANILKALKMLDSYSLIVQFTWELPYIQRTPRQALLRMMSF